MNIEHYDLQARTIKHPLYVYYAQKIKERTKISEGRCLDVGSCGGYLGLELAKITNLHVTFFDLSLEALEKAQLHLEEDNLKERGEILKGDVHQIPLNDETMDLVISRGSLPFWEEPALALKEIYRILKKGGSTFVGGGKGPKHLKEQILAQMIENSQYEDAKAMNTMHGDGMKRDYAALLESEGIFSYKVYKEDDGTWIQMWK